MQYTVIEERDCAHCKKNIGCQCVVWECKFERRSELQGELYFAAKNAIEALKKDNKYLAKALLSEVMNE